MLFSAELATGLFGHFLAAISGANLYRKASFLEGALGQTLFPDWLTLDERPHLLRALGSAAYDGDGLATYAKPFVEQGRLLSYVLGTYSGRKLGMPSTANAGGVHNLFVSHGEADQAALIRQMGRGLLVTELMGQGLNLVTGDYSRGAGGYWVENGEIQFPVQEVTIAAICATCSVRSPRSLRRGDAQQCSQRFGTDRADDGCRQLNAVSVAVRAAVRRGGYSPSSK